MGATVCENIVLPLRGKEITSQRQMARGDSIESPKLSFKDIVGLLNTVGSLVAVGHDN